MLALGANDATRYERLTISDGPHTRYGRIELAGEVHDAEPMLVRRFRVVDGFVLSLVSRGTGRYLTRTYPPRPITGPTVTMVAPGEEHWYGTEPGERWTEWFAVVQGPLFTTVTTAGGRPFRSGPRSLADGALVSELGRILSGPPQGTAAAEDQIWALAHWVAAVLREPVDAAETELWNRALALLVDDFTSTPALTAVAAELGLSYPTFRRRFHGRFGQAPLAYRNERRLELAGTLLRLTALSCREIADRLGYSDEFHFSKRFKQRYGVAPIRYRQE